MKAIRSILLIVCLALIIAPPVYAAEVNPVAGTYSYGSTSEASDPVLMTEVAATTPTSRVATLAPSGQSQTAGVIAIAGLLALASLALALLLGAKKHHSI